MLKDFDFEKKDKTYQNFKRSELGESLDQVHRVLQRLKIPVLVMVEGWGTSGKGQCLKDLTRELDPHGVRVEVFDQENDLEKKHPWLWRYCLRLPNNQEMVFFDQSIYHPLLARWAEGADEAYQERLQQAKDMEKSLVQNNTIVLKFFLHIKAQTQSQRIKTLQKASYSDYRISPSDYEEEANYSAYLDWMDQVLTDSSSTYCPWQLINAEDQKAAAKEILGLTLKGIQDGIDRITASRAEEASLSRNYQSRPTAYDRVDLTKTVSQEDYDAKLRPLQEEAGELVFEAFVKDVPIVALFEGPDAAGKDGAIKRLTRHIDPRSYKIFNIKAPTDEEKSRHYLWRFERDLPLDGQMSIFSRSWYGRVLVERVDNLTPERLWEEAYDEINAFESRFQAHGIILFKYFLVIDQEEQLRRFLNRLETPAKRYKLTQDDWHNRSKWADYQAAYREMFDRTDTAQVPWQIIPANNKKYARLKVLEIFNQTLKNFLK